MPHRCSTRPILSLALIATISNASYSSIAPILPLELDRHSIPEQWISLIFLAFPIGFSMASPLVARHLETHGAAKVMALGMAFQSVLFYFLGGVFDAAEYMSSMSSSPSAVPEDEVTEKHMVDVGSRQTWIVGMISITQLFLGAAMSMITTGYYSTATLLFPTQKESAMSYIESSVGVGYVIGPIIGSAIYDEIGYEYAYSTVSFGMILMAVVTWKILASCLRVKERSDCDADVDDEMDVFDVEAQEQYTKRNSLSENKIDVKEDEIADSKQPKVHHDMTAMSLLKQPKFFITALNILWVNVAWTFMEPILAKRLDEFHIGNKGIGIIFALSNLVYIPSAFFMPHLHKYCHRKQAIFLSILSTPMAVLLVGSTSFPLVAVGIALLGLLPTPVWILLLPFLQDHAMAPSNPSNKFPDSRVKRRVNDLTAGIYNSFMTLGQVVGYVIGPMLNGLFGFGNTTCIVAFFIFAHSIVFYFGGVGGGGSVMVSFKYRRRRSVGICQFTNLC